MPDLISRGDARNMPNPVFRRDKEKPVFLIGMIEGFVPANFA